MSQTIPEAEYNEAPSRHPCREIKDAIIECVKLSDCMRNGGKFHECMKSKDLEDDCKEFLYAYYKCKKDMFDTRNRFRGNVAAKAFQKDMSEKRRKREEEENESPASPSENKQ
ncbi:hypothetical protein CYY_007557 [Polysphondylium violaceum]|uniref:Cytochrome c oxidase assembly factor 5 n=1 Tax=Polysphondylium violaceum TaxID=133409 RepID=A0A8J4UXY5_9MYCE|nr:hypothetical protein CYY_007557 [Polysphondylium violaceum]